MIHRFLLSLLLLSISISLFSQDQLLQTGFDKLSKRNFEGAVQDFNRVLVTKPDQIEAMCGRAEARINLGIYAEAMKDVDQVLTIEGNNGKALALKGEILFAQKDYQNALKAFERAALIPNALVHATIGKSKVLNQQGNPKDAFKILDDAIEKQPSNAEYYYARGLLNNTREKYSKALLDFDKALALNPNLNAFNIYLNRGVAYMNLDEMENALQDFTKAIELDPSNASAYHSRGLARYQADDFKLAVEDFLKSVDLNPSPVTYYNLGMAYNNLGDKGNACLYFHKSCSLGNTNSCKMIIMVCSDAKPNR